MTCPDDIAILDFVAGRLGAEEVAALDAHLDECADCRAVIVSMHGVREPPTQRFGRFHIVDTVGAGAMGVVYAAVDPELDRRVAVKVIRSDVDSPTARERLLAEARSMAQVSHPNVIPIFDVGSTDAAVFIAMELVDGQTLRAWCALGSRPWQDVLARCLEAGRGLAAAHAAGVVHRDYKPDNVLVGGTRARVGDFGLATGMLGQSRQTDLSRTADRYGDPSTTTTQEGLLIGTPAYMAPEQLQGRAADAQSDQFAFCVATYELLCGVRPFAGTTVAAVRAKIEAQHLATPKRDIPQYVISALARGLRADPAARHRDMPALLTALTGRRRRTGFVLAATVLLATASFGAVALGRAEPPLDPPCTDASTVLERVWNQKARRGLSDAFARAAPDYGKRSALEVAAAVDRWAEQWVATRDETCRTREQLGTLQYDQRMLCLDGHRDDVGELVRTLGSIETNEVDSALNAALRLPEPSACAAVDGLEPPSSAVAADVERIRAEVSRSWVALDLGRFEEASQRIAAVRDEVGRIAYPPLLAEVELAWAHAARGNGDWQQARDAALEASLTAEAARHDILVARAWTALVEIESGAGRHPEALEQVPKARAAVKRLDGQPALEASLQNVLGVVLDNLGRYDEARAALLRALELNRLHLGPTHPGVAVVLTNLGNLARNRQRFDEALRLHREAMSIDRAALGEGHPALGRHHHNVARLLLLTGDDEAALEHYEHALRIKTATLGDTHVEVARTLNSLGLLYDAQGEHEAALERYRRALAIYERHAHPERGLVHFNIGRQQLAVGDAAAALKSFERARPVLRALGGTSSRHWVELSLATADAQLELGQRKKARAGYADALPLARALDDGALVEHAGDGYARSRPRSVRRAPPPKPNPLPSAGAYAPGPGFDRPKNPNAP